MREAIIERSRLIGSGIITQSEKLDGLVSGGGRTINMPIWSRLGGESVVASDETPLEPQGINTKKDVATMHLRDHSWGANELASAIAGDSAIEAIAAQLAEWWVRDEQRILIATLVGMFASPTMSTHVLDKGTTPIDANLTLDAKQLLGDASDQLSAILMHSRTFTQLQKLNLIDYIPDARGEIAFDTYLGYRVIVDDTMPSEGGVYSTYLMANGVVGRGDGSPVDRTAVETDRDSLMGVDILVHRRSFALHPMGVSWVGDADGTTPTNDELRDGTNWKRVYDVKHIGMVELKHAV
jgi:hypothetical protein